MAKILIVDDDPDITFRIASSWREGYEVVSASNRADGMQARGVQAGPDDPRRHDGTARRRDPHGAGTAPDRPRVPILMLTSVGR